MNGPSTGDHLSRISTQWTLVRKAHEGSIDTALLAQHELLQRYCGATYRYLLAAVRDPDAAEELSQEFSLRFLRGDFKRADPERGRFRDYVKTVLINLVIQYRKKQDQARAVPMSAVELAAPESSLEDLDKEFVDGWREELLARAWEALAEEEDRSGKPFHTVLHFRAEHPELSSEQMAEQLSTQMGKPLTNAGVRQTLHRARQKYAELLLKEVELSLQTLATERLEQELIDLGLLTYCRSALKLRGGQA